jgi:probable HAF family extracellular repeat protein
MFSDEKKRVSTLVTRYFVFPLLIIATGAWGQTYTAVDLGATDPFTVGSTGQVVGVIQNSNDYEQPFITVDGNIKALDALHNDDTARAVAVNSSGVAVGYSCLAVNPECSAVTWVAGGTPTTFAEGFSPKAINDAGEIVGSLYQSNSSGITSPSGLAIWQKGVFSPLPWLSQAQGGSAGALPNAINSAGVIAGELYLIDANNAITGYAVVWAGSKIQNLGANAAAKGINDHGQVVGFSGNDAALWTNGVLTDLGNLEGGFTVAYAINNSGIIVGTANVPYSPSMPYETSAAVVWIGGTLYQLIDLIKPTLPHNIQLEYGQAINDAGQIVASGFDPVEHQYHAYLLSPAGVASAAAPTFSVLPRTYVTTQTVTIADVTPAATIHYTLDGTTPTTQSPVYSAALTISRTTSLKAIAIAAGYQDSAVASAAYTILVPSNAYSAVDLSSVANVQAMGPLGVRAHVGLDGYRNVYASELMGSSLYWSGVQFDFVDSLSANGAAAVTVSLPAGKYSALKLLGTSTRGNRSVETFVVTYTDGTSSTIVRGMSDWLTPQSYPGESTALTMDHRIEHSGTASAGPYHLYGYALNLNPAKTVQSLTLPASSYVVVLAGALISNAQSTTASLRSPD